ncbi:MAG: aminodeoxychorismate synthase component I [Acidobacteria bacterium]|nr:aminodeoxychorismate synthase component I [Acidobacteriota bacterium]MBP8275048.1 aminodeoxychorismate synthase component I [Acidobacteriota bacterium]
MILRDAASGRWRRFANPVEVVDVRDCADVVPALRRIEARVNNDQLHAAGFVSYDAAPAFDAALAARRSPDTPLLWFGLFDHAEWIDTPVPPAESPALTWSPSVTREEYDAAIARIKTHIADGDTYQVNHTFRLHADLPHSPWEFFRELVAAQDADFAAYVDTGSLAICSVSPELFFTLDDRALTSRPMKGTTRRGRFAAEDAAQAEWLRTSAKNRAENVMIVDMVRNDIGRVAEVGTVEVSRLFDTERYPTVWQMTSTVTGRTDASVADIFSALFPCASITGAPKARTTEIIAALEPTPRGVYTGAIGTISPGRQAQFSVAIRTAVIDTASGRAEYGVGGGITWESDATDEYDECLAKARVLTERRPDFSLLETLRWDPHTGYALIDRHLDRLHTSAQYFDRRVDLTAVRAQLDRTASALTEPHIVRLLVDRRGAPRCESAPLAPSTEPVRLALAPSPIDASDVFLLHKTTNRGVYDRARASSPDADDVILWNARGEITETTIANVIVVLNGEWWTPPITCGLLAGTARAELIETGKARERVITIDELRACEELYVVNSVRGVRRAILTGAPS